MVISERVKKRVRRREMESEGIEEERKWELEIAVEKCLCE